MLNNFLVIGLHRSGTNYLRKLIQENFFIKPLPDYSHKFVDEVNFNNNVLYLVIQKQYDLWYKSIYKNNTGANSFRLEFTEPYRDVYDRFYNGWIKSNKAEIVSYTDLLQNFSVCLDYLQNKYNLKPKHSFYKNVFHVNLSTPFTEDKRRQYLSVTI